MGKYDGLTPIVEESESRHISPGRGREKRTGKSANREEYRQISVYLKRQIHHQAQRALIGTAEDFSDLVNRLVADWLQSEILADDEMKSRS
jgi:hypothetical protein